MSYYKTGTISVTANSTTVTGSGTAWVDNARVGDMIRLPNGQLHEITARASNTSMTVFPAYAGATASNQAYFIAPVDGYPRDLADRAAALITAVGELPAKVDAKAAINSPVLTGTPKAPTPASDADGVQVQTVAGVLAAVRKTGLAMEGDVSNWWPADDLTSPAPSGMYRVAKVVANRPSSTGLAFVLSAIGGTSTGVQMYIDSNAVLYTGIKNNGVWNPFVRNLSYADKATPAQLTAGAANRWIDAALAKTALDAKVGVDAGYNTVGSLQLCVKTTTGAASGGAVIPGSALQAAKITKSANDTLALTAGTDPLTGSWRNLSQSVAGDGVGVGIFQRIA